MFKGQPMTAMGGDSTQCMGGDGCWPVKIGCQKVRKHPSLWLVEHDPSCGKINTYYIYIYHVTICHDINITILNHTNRIPIHTNRIPILPTWWEPHQSSACSKRLWASDASTISDFISWCMETSCFRLQVVTTGSWICHQLLKLTLVDNQW